VAIFRAGKLEQFDSPDNILAHPINDFIADFVGTDRTLKRLRLVKVGAAIHSTAPRVVGHEALDRAAALMAEHGQDFIVVVDPNGRPHAYVELDVCRERSGTAAEHGARLPATVRLDDDLRTAVSLMFMHDTGWLACVDEAGNFAGFVTRKGITRLLGKTYRNATAEVGR
jgi:osmoprotectant transport system ATP-binding protein